MKERSVIWEYGFMEWMDIQITVACRLELWWTFLFPRIDSWIPAYNPPADKVYVLRWLCFDIEWYFPPTRSWNGNQDYVFLPPSLALRKLNYETQIAKVSQV